MCLLRVEVATGRSPKSLGALLANAARNFAVLSAPMRLHVLNSLSHGEKNVSELLANLPTTQSNLSQHLGMLYKAKFIATRRVGTQIYYSITDERIIRLCNLMCERE